MVKFFNSQISIFTAYKRVFYLLIGTCLDKILNVHRLCNKNKFEYKLACFVIYNSMLGTQKLEHA